MTIAPRPPGGNVCVKCEMWVKTWLRVLVSWSCISGGRCENESEGALCAYGEDMPPQKPFSLFHVVQICPGTKTWLGTLLATNVCHRICPNWFCTFIFGCICLHAVHWPACLFTGECFYLQGLLLPCFDFESWNASGLVIQISWYVQLWNWNKIIAATREEKGAEGTISPKDAGRPSAVNHLAFSFSRNSNFSKSFCTYFLCL